MGEKNNDLTEIISQALNEMKRDLGSLTLHTVEGYPFVSPAGHREL